MSKAKSAEDLTFRLLAGSQRPFLWITHKGKVMQLGEMATNHLFYTIRMLFNHSVAPVFRVGELRRYPDVGTWPLRYRRVAVEAMLREFFKRDDRENEQNDEVQDMIENSKVIRALGLEQPDDARDWEDTQH